MPDGAVASTAMTALDVCGGFLPGFEPVPRLVRTATSPRAAFDEVLRRALSRPPCFVAFSGGRDSSAVLAAAAALARREGLPEPLAVTVEYPGVPAADESAWQELVLEHVGLSSHRLDGSDHKDLLGELGTAVLRRLGPTWPVSAHDKAPLYALARGGSLLTGEGGDEMLGPQRITPVVGTWRRRRPIDRRALGAIGFALAPRPVRHAVLRRSRWQSWPWLRPAAHRAFERLVLADEASRPLSWGRAVRRLPSARSAVVGLRTLDVLAAEHDVQLFHPFLDRAFADALALSGGHAGFVSRTENMTRLFGDVLPEPVLRRQTKAAFNDVALGARARAFVEAWDGTGLPEDLVDVEVLRDLWLAPAPHAGTFLLLQLAWCASQDSAWRDRYARASP